MSAEPARLHPADLEQLAVRVAELLRNKVESNPAAGERLLTADQVAERLHCTRRYVLRLAREGRLERVKRPGGKTVLFRESAIDAYLERGRQAPVDVGAAAATLLDMPTVPTSTVSARRERLR